MNSLCNNIFTILLAILSVKILFSNINNEIIII